LPIRGPPVLPPDGLGNPSHFEKAITCFDFEAEKKGRHPA